MWSMENFLNAPYPEEPLDFYGQSKEITNHELGLVQIERISSFDKFPNTLYSEEPMDFEGQDKQRTNNELSMVQDQCSGVNHEVQFVADAESNALNSLNSGYAGYNNEEGLVTSYLELDKEDLYSQNCDLLDKEFGITHAPIVIKQDHVLQSQSQSCVKNYGELPFDASILDDGSEECTPEDCLELPNNMENDKREETSTSTKQNLVADSPLTNESPAVLSAEERRRQYNRESARRSRANTKAKVNLFEEVRPSLLKIAIADTGNLAYLTHLVISLQKQLKDSVASDEAAAIALGVPAEMMRQSPSSLQRAGRGCDHCKISIQL
ncbi:hypothetical protein M6B38_179015 [Iris pallida]|uniref:Uncharacterized protein n=1 Tax=Iris pallida TaxID=29817 RepID=A0AAX6EN59_IRIPA|nr:hypothetical protein M6B38_179015 [Iris pallida]